MRSPETQDVRDEELMTYYSNLLKQLKIALDCLCSEHVL
jgi:hypothetical protein